MNISEEVPHNSTELQWGSVRKVRTVDEIASLLLLSTKKGSIDFEELRKSIVKARVDQATVYLVTRRRRVKNLAELYDDPRALTTLAEDRRAFAKGVGIWIDSKGLMQLTALGSSIKAALLNKNDRNVVLLNLLFESRYKAYRLFIERLAKLGGKFIIPSVYASRKKETGAREYLASKGFFTDLPSFHTIKELFYDFQVVNWRVEPKRGSETIFLTRGIHQYHEVPLVQRLMKNIKGKVPLSEVDLTEFVSCFDLAIKALNFETDAYHDIISIRDEVCERLLISDQSFAKLLQKATSTKSRFRNRLFVGVGPLVDDLPMGYAQKLRTLPELFEGEPITKMMIV